MTLDLYQIFLILIVIVFNFPIVALVARRARREAANLTYAVNVPRPQLRREKLNALLTTPVHGILMAAFLYSGLLEPANETLMCVLYTFALTFVWTEVWHYASHIAMHSRALHFIHREHHLSRITNAWTSLSFSFLEKLIFSVGIIGFIALLSHHIPVSFSGLVLYYLLYFYTNALGHSNIEIRNKHYYSSWMGKVFNTPSYHAMHHARYTGNYGLLTPYLDLFFNTAWSDYKLVQYRAAEQKPLLKLKEKA